MVVTRVGYFQKIRSWSSNLPFLSGVVLVLAFGVLDFLTGAEISFSIFYLIPIYLVAWYVGRWPSILVSILAGTVWLSAELLSDEAYSHLLIPFWNMGVRLFVFLLTGWLISEIRIREARRRALERIFFHDVLNAMTGVRGFAEYLHDCAALEHKEACATILSAAEQVVQEIEDQRIISAAEHHELHLEPTSLNSRLMLEQVLAWYTLPKEERKIDLQLAPESEEVFFISDQALVSRVLGNMVKNALEAAQPTESVTAGCRKSGTNIDFWVHNPQHIPSQIQSRIFQPSFSTKGRDRGLGAYSIRLLTKELGGDVFFTSSPENGTTFTARYPLE